MRFSKLLILLIFFSLFGCQDILECIINREPELSNKSLKLGSKNSFYSDVIRAEIRNEPRDNDYYYDYYVTGDIPVGIEIFFDYRDVIIEGIQQESGDFYFTINLFVEQADNYCENNFNDCDGLCSDSVSREYVLTIL